MASGWTNPPSNWTGEDCLEWAREVCHQHFLDPTECNIDVFSRMSGGQLLCMTLNDLEAVVGVFHAATFHESRQTLLKTYLSENIYTRSERNVKSRAEPHSSYAYRGACIGETREFDPTLGSTSSMFASDTSSDTRTHKPYPTTSQEANYMNTSVGDALLGTGLSNSEIELFDRTLEITGDCSGHDYVGECASLTDDDIPHYGLCEESSQLSDELISSSHWFAAVPGSRNNLKSPSVLVFMWRLLEDTRTHGVLVRWIDRSTGVFQIMEEERLTVARMWRNYRFPEKRAYPVNYDNFAKTLRSHYNAKTKGPGAVEYVPHRFIYKFEQHRLQKLMQFGYC